MKTQLSLIIPAYNEEKLIKETLLRFISFLNHMGYEWEIIVADDGSKDKTASIVTSFKNPRIRLLSLPQNQGKGAALKTGFLAAKGTYQIFSDADLSVPIETIEPFLQKLESFDVVIASRRVKGSEIKVHQPWVRENMGRVFTFLTKLFTGSSVADFTCGFKGFKKEAARKIFSHCLISRWAYDAEIIYLAQKLGYRIFQHPVSWTNRKDTRVRLNKVVFESLRDLIKIRVFDVQGKYD